MKPDMKHDMKLTVRAQKNDFGARIHGAMLTADSLSQEFPLIHQAFIRHQVLIFEDVAVSPTNQVALARMFGHVQVHVMNQYHDGAHPELYTLSNLDKDGKPSGQHPDKGTLVWHTDGSWMPKPGLATFMYAVEIPQEGGQTHFCDMYSAWSALTPQEQAQYLPLVIQHSLDFSRQRRHGEEPMTDEQRRQVPPVQQPLVRRHPDSNRACLFLGDHAECVIGMEYEAGRKFVDALNKKIVSNAHIYEHHWQPNQLVIWDNRSVLHKATPYDTARDRRVIRRCTVLCDEHASAEQSA